MCENYIRFIENHDTYGLSKLTEKESDKLLESEKYTKLNKSIIESAGRLKNEELEHTIISVDANYNYLMGLSYRQMNADCHSKLLKRLKSLKKELKELAEPGSYKKIWRDEITQLWPLIKRGVEDGFYKEDDTLFK
jgi:hypothetical protein